MARKAKLKADDIDRILASMNRVLKRRGVDQPVQLRFSSIAGQCWERVCREQPNGTVRCTWERRPC
jgi:hypothetical protein